MSRSIFKNSSCEQLPLYGPAIYLLRQRAHLLMEQAHDAQCRGQVSRVERFTTQATALNRAAGFLEDFSKRMAGQSPSQAPSPTAKKNQ